PPPGAAPAAAAGFVGGTAVGGVALGVPVSDAGCTAPLRLLAGLIGLPPPLPPPPPPLPALASGLASAAGLSGLAAFFAASPPSLPTCWPSCWAICPTDRRGLALPSDCVSGPSAPMSGWSMSCIPEGSSPSDFLSLSPFLSLSQGALSP